MDDLKKRAADINQQAMDITDHLCSRGDTMPMRGQVEAQARQMLHAMVARGWTITRDEPVSEASQKTPITAKRHFCRF